MYCTQPERDIVVAAGVGILSFDMYDGLPVQRLPLQRVGTHWGSTALAAAPGDAGGGLDGFEDLEVVLSPETAAASRAAEAEAAEVARSAPTDAPKSGVTLLGGLVTAQSKVSWLRVYQHKVQVFQGFAAETCAEQGQLIS